MQKLITNGVLQHSVSLDSLSDWKFTGELNSMKVGDKVRAIRDHWCTPLFDEGWWVRKGMIGTVYALDQGDGEIAIDFGNALDSRKRNGWVVLVVPLDAIELVL